MPSITPYAAGKLSGAVYAFGHVGDELAAHVHDAASNHITIIMQGSFRCTGNHLIDGKVLRQGQVVDWPTGEPHGFVALEPNSRMLQIIKGE